MVNEMFVGSGGAQNWRELYQSLTIKCDRALCQLRVWGVRDIAGGLQVVAAIAMFGCMSLCLAQVPTEVESAEHKAWDLLQNAANGKSAENRADVARALGLIPGNSRARETAENLLQDRKPEVRVAAATALGQMHATESIPNLEEALQDRNIPVVMAAADSLRLLQESGSADAVYIELLTGERKSGDGLVAQQMSVLHNRKELAKMGISEGVSFVPFGGIAWHAYRVIHKQNPNPVRAVAATNLANDPDPAIARALVRATDDKNWIVRVAAIQAIAQRGDPALLPKVQIKFSDPHAKVRYSAAATVVHLSAIQTSEMAREEKLSGADGSARERGAAGTQYFAAWPPDRW